MNYDPRTESEANYICHLVAENEGLERLGHKSRHDVFSTFRRGVAYFRDKYYKMCEDNFEGKYKAVRIHLLNPEATIEEIRALVNYLDDEGIVGSRDIFK